MSKTLKIVFILLISYFGLILEAKALFAKDTIYDWDGYTEVNDTSNYNNKTYTLYNNKHYLKTHKNNDKNEKRLANVVGYCLTPKQPNANNNYKVEEVLDPTTSEFALATYLAYTILIKEGHITQDKQVASVVSPTLRLVASRYGRLSGAGDYHTDTTYKGYYTPYVLKSDGTVKNPQFFKGKYGGAALNIYYTVLNKMNSLAYLGTVRQKFDVLANEQSIHVAKWTAIRNWYRSISATQVQVNFRLDTNVSNDKTNWNSFRCGSNCLSLTRNGDGTFTAIVPAGVSSFTIYTSQNVWQNYEGRFAIVKYSDHPDSWQPMLLVYTGTSTTSTEVGVEVPAFPKCKYVRDPVDGGRDYYDSQGVFTDVYTYRSQCVKTCVKEKNKYICKNTDPDDSGPECKVQEYEEQCTFCGMYRQICMNNPSDPGCPSNYFEECPNCNPSVSMPASCNDLDTESTVTGKISDINEEKTTCNPSVKPVKGCVIGRTDLAGNVYEVANKLINNRFCKIYCYENYEFGIPTARRSTSGGYFNLAMQITGTRSCYIGSENMQENVAFSSNLQFDYEKFKNTVTDLNNEIQTPGVSEERILEASKELKQVIEEYKDCTTLSGKWGNEMNFDPVVKYEYQEYKNGSGSKGTFKITGDVETEYENTYCYSQTDSQYNCVDDKKIVTTGEGDQVPGAVTFPDNTTTYEPIEYYECGKNGARVECTKVQDVVSTAIGVEKKVTKKATLTPSQNFTTYHQYGTVKTGNICENANINGYNNCLWTRLPDEALPVELKTGKGAFPYKLYVSNIGQYSGGEMIENTLGRLIGNSKSIINEYNKLQSAQKCSYFDNKNNALVQETGYVCGYINNCDECDVRCEGDFCDLEICEDCKVTCRTCIFDGNNSTFKYRTVSLNNLFPNKCEGDNKSDCREAGYNWNSKKADTNGASKKAAVTIGDIENSGERALEEDKKYSYTLTPMQLKAIRDYNKEAGTYANTQMPYNEVFKTDEVALQCEQVTYDNGITYSVKCLSTFLNDESGTYFTSNIPREETTKFTLWTDTDYCLRGSCLSKTDGVGPSWK